MADLISIVRLDITAAFPTDLTSHKAALCIQLYLD